MAADEGEAVAAVENAEVLTNGDIGAREGEILKATMESPNLPTETTPKVLDVLDAPDVRDLQDVTDVPKVEEEKLSAVAEEEPNGNLSAALDSSTTPGDVKVEAIEQNPEGEEKAGDVDAVLANGNSEPRREENGDDIAGSSQESDGVTILPHWHAKPCVHITGLGGIVTEEDLLPLLNPHGKIVSFVFENDRRDSAIVRYEASGTEGEGIVVKVREILNNKQIKDKSLMVEPFRPDSLLFIGNLTPEIDDAALRKMFEPHGTIERAFVLKNAGGRSKGYGFVEYSLKSQASAAKVAMGNINMDGRVLRVEWSDCRKICDMFSTVLFVDRISKDSAHIEQTLRNIFGKFGRVRDCHLVIGVNQQLRGFAFIDFYHSAHADKAHEALDGQEVEGSNIRVSFANPSKSAQSYKSRQGAQTTVQAVGNHSRGPFQEHVIRPVGPVVGAAMRAHTSAPVVGNRYMTPARNNMLGMSLGMQFGRGAPVGPGMIGRNLVSPLIANGAGMLGPGSVAGGMIGRTPAMMLSHAGQRGVVPGAYGQQGARLAAGRGHLPVGSNTMAQVATAQAKAREEEAKARAEAQVKQSQTVAKQSAAEQERLEQFRKMAAQQAQLMPQPGYYQQHTPSSGLDQQYKQSSSQYAYQQPYQQSGHLQSTPVHTQYQLQPAAQQALDSQQSHQSHQSRQSHQPQQSYNPQYYTRQPTQQYPQQGQQLQVQQSQSQPQPTPQARQQHQSTEQYPQQQTYYQQTAQQSAAQTGIGTQQLYSQYNQQYGQQYPQQYAQQLQQSQPSQPSQPSQQSQQSQLSQQSQQSLQSQQSQLQRVQMYGQQPTPQQYTDIAQVQAPAQYTEQDYANYYAQQQQQQPQVQQTQTPVVAGAGTTTGTTLPQTADVSQQAYAAYYQQRAQEAVAQAGTTAAQTSAAAGSATSLEAQWAAYYAAQAAQQQAGTTTIPTAYDQQSTSYAQQQQPYTAGTAYYQQAATADVGQKRTADQVDYLPQSQASYGYQQPSSAVAAQYDQQQAATAGGAYQQSQATAANAYQQQQQSTPSVASYQQPAGGYQQHAAVAVPTYSQQASSISGYAPVAGGGSGAGGYQHASGVASLSGYQQSAALAGYQQQPSAAASVPSYNQQTPQTTAAAPVYDYNKRVRY